MALSAKHESFIRMMRLSAEHARRGFELLLKRSDFSLFFDALNREGLFNSNNNSPPLLVEDGLYRVPFWDALNYLTEVARASGATNDSALAEKVMLVVRETSNQRDANGDPPDNYHTHRKFAEILGLVPPSVVRQSDIAFISAWLTSNFDRGLVIHALDDALHNFLRSEDIEDLKKACEILDRVTASFQNDTSGKNKRHSQSSENHWFKLLLEHHSTALGERIPEVSAEILSNRIKEITGQGSSYWRSAIENHPQNFSHDARNSLVDGMRDVLLAWADTDPNAASVYVENLIARETEIFRRIGIYVLSEKWSTLRSIYLRVINTVLLNDAHLHELYGLLKKNFSTFSDSERENTLVAVMGLQEGNERTRKRIQRNWLSAMIGNDYHAVDALYDEISKDPSVGPLSQHPDFGQYVESFSGPGPSPYSSLELIAFAKSGEIVDRLNAYQPVDNWKGPNRRALADVLENTIVSNPDTFVEILPEFIGADRPYQYAVIEGFRRLWEADENTQNSIRWDVIWPSLLKFFLQLLSDTNFWTEKNPETDVAPLVPTRDWIPPAIANTLRAGTRSDSHAYPESLLDSGWNIIVLLLRNLKADDNGDDSDQMGRAINTSRGKAIESLMSHSLRVCRTSDAHSSSHVDAWMKMQPIFDDEILKCRNANFEFSTLAGCYLANLEYMNSKWLALNINKIFSKEYPRNFSCAISGLAYAPATQNIHRMLVENKIFEHAVTNNLASGSNRERLIERIVLGHLWEPVDEKNSEIGKILDPNFSNDKDILSAITFLWTLRGQAINNVQRGKIATFFADVVTWEKSRTERDTHILSTVSLLACYVDKLEESEVELLKTVAPHTYVAYNTDYFVEELDRLAEKYPAQVCIVLASMLSIQIPIFDFEDRLKTLLRKLFANGQRVPVLHMLQKLSSMEGMLDLYEEVELKH